MAAQCARGITEVLRQCIDERPSTAVAIGLFHLLHPAERPSRLSSSTCRGQTPAFVLGREQLEVRPDFVIECATEPPPPKERAGPRDDGAKQHHHSARNATIGSTRVARRAGKNDANAQIPMRNS